MSHSVRGQQSQVLFPTQQSCLLFFFTLICMCAQVKKDACCDACGRKRTIRRSQFSPTRWFLGMAFRSLGWYQASSPTEPSSLAQEPLPSCFYNVFIYAPKTWPISLYFLYRWLRTFYKAENVLLLSMN